MIKTHISPQHLPRPSPGDRNVPAGGASDGSLTMSLGTGCQTPHGTASGTRGSCCSPTRLSVLVAQRLWEIFVETLLGRKEFAPPVSCLCTRITARKRRKSPPLGILRIYTLASLAAAYKNFRKTISLRVEQIILVRWNKVLFYSLIFSSQTKKSNCTQPWNPMSSKRTLADWWEGVWTT